MDLCFCPRLHPQDERTISGLSLIDRRKVLSSRRHWSFSWTGTRWGGPPRQDVSWTPLSTNQNKHILILIPDQYFHSCLIVHQDQWCYWISITDGTGLFFNKWIYWCALMAQYLYLSVTHLNCDIIRGVCERSPRSLLAQKHGRGFDSDGGLWLDELGSCDIRLKMNSFYMWAHVHIRNTHSCVCVHALTRAAQLPFQVRGLHNRRCLTDSCYIRPWNDS